MNILILEDDPAQARSLEILLAEQGHRVYSFTDPQKAGSCVISGLKADVLILDYALPEITCDKWIEQYQPHIGLDSRIILISGDTDKVTDLNLKNLGIRAFLPKPLRIDDLFEAIMSD